MTVSMFTIFNSNIPAPFHLSLVNWKVKQTLWAERHSLKFTIIQFCQCLPRSLCSVTCIASFRICKKVLIYILPTVVAKEESWLLVHFFLQGLLQVLKSLFPFPLQNIFQLQDPHFTWWKMQSIMLIVRDKWNIRKNCICLQLMHKLNSSTRAKWDGFNNLHWGDQRWETISVRFSCFTLF